MRRVTEMQGLRAWERGCGVRTRVKGAALASLMLVCLLAGCETGRTTKAHAGWQHISDATTTGKPETRQARTPGDHQPPVPGSPTAAGADGNQPLDDMQARGLHDSEPEAAPHAQPADPPTQHKSD